jgi:hypothetical protein
MIISGLAVVFRNYCAMKEREKGKTRQQAGFFLFRLFHLNFLVILLNYQGICSQSVAVDLKCSMEHFFCGL